MLDCLISRHDPHNLEIKFSISSVLPEISGHIQVILFFPKSVKLTLFSKTELVKDFYSRLRVTHPATQNYKRTMHYILQEYDELIIAANCKEDIKKATQRLGAFYGEIIKQKKIAHIKALEERIHFSVLYAIERVEQFIQFHESFIDDIQLRLNLNPKYLPLFFEYIEPLYMQYFNAITKAYQKIDNSTLNEDEQVEKEKLLILLHARAVENGRLTHIHSLETKEGREMYLLRLSQLKRFFQSFMFIEVKRKQVVNFFTEPVAILAAGLAALWASYFQGANITSGGIGGYSLLILGIAAYILKDRLKDKSKSYLANQAQRYFSDQSLSLHSGEREIGRLKEKFEIKKSKNLDKEIRQIRKDISWLDTEKYIEEDVLVFSRKVSLNPKSQRTEAWALQESLRVNIERYLKHLDDPYRDFTWIDEEGNSSKESAHRIYPLTIIVQANLNPKTAFFSKKIQGENQYFTSKIPLDKNGIHEGVRSCQLI